MSNLTKICIFLTKIPKCYTFLKSAHQDSLNDTHIDMSFSKKKSCAHRGVPLTLKKLKWLLGEPETLFWAEKISLMVLYYATTKLRDPFKLI